MTNEQGNVVESKNSMASPSQYSKKKKGYFNELRRLFITVGIFLMMQMFFIVIDGTFLEPNLNKVGTFVSNIAENNVFEWIVIYDNPVLKFITVIAVLHIMYLLIKTIILRLKEKENSIS